MIKICINVTSHAFDPSPCHKLSHLLGSTPPSSVTYFMDGPFTSTSKVCKANDQLTSFADLDIDSVRYVKGL